MSLLGRTFGFLTMAAVTVVCCFAFSNPPTNPEAGVVVWLPETIPGHDSEEIVMSAKEKIWLPLDTTYWAMSYRPELASKAEQYWKSIKATLIVAGTDSRSLHRPEVCLASQGWAVEKREVVSLETNAGPLEVMDFHLVRLLKDPKNNNKVVLNDQGEPLKLRAHYFYWWVGPDHSTPDDKERVWRSTLNSILKGRNERWAYPSVMTQVEYWKGEEGIREARERAVNFIKEYAPEFQKSLGAKDGKDRARELVTLVE